MVLMLTWAILVARNGDLFPTASKRDPCACTGNAQEYKQANRQAIIQGDLSLNEEQV